MTKHFTAKALWVTLILALVGVMPAARASEPAPIAYTIQFPDLKEHIAQINMSVPTDARPSVDLMMAVWSPGFYRVENYASRVQSFSARTADGKTLQVERPRSNRWRIFTNGQPNITVSYRLKCAERSVTTDWVGEDFAVFNGPATFITLVESGHRPHEVRIELPASWKQSICSLDAASDGKPGHYRAPDFDTLADSPIVAGNPVVAEFEVAGSKHSIAGVGVLANWDTQQTAHDFKMIASENLRMWGFLPFKRYVFLVCSRRGGGGLEHLNSTLLTANPATLRSPRGLGFVSHEYFHAYNVKRLRPIELGPFDYEKPRARAVCG
jgi:predicted metalloprotease with PDZ domain